MRKLAVMNKHLIFLSIISAIFTTTAYATQTPCASQVFANALAQSASNVRESDSEDVIQQWIYSIFTDKNTISNVLACPEIASVADNETIAFTPVQYIFPMGREVVVKYETQPKILKQRLSLANKRELPESDPNPRIGAPDDNTIWTYTDPAWYAIMVVESGALSNFVGPNKNNTISLKYINDNIDSLYPQNSGCTTKHAFARDSKPINQAVKQTVNIENDSNDYYVAGDANLAWIGYTEIALDVVITVATMGGGMVLTGITKSARASRALKGLSSTLGGLRKLDTVQD